MIRPPVPEAGRIVDLHAVVFRRRGVLYLATTVDMAGVEVIRADDARFELQVTQGGEPTGVAPLAHPDGGKRGD